jgi:limonene-1,2-epoxide hydrolase
MAAWSQYQISPQGRYKRRTGSCISSGGTSQAGDQAASRAAPERSKTITTATLPPAVAAYLSAVNAFDLDGIVAAFAPDAYVNDARREINGIEAIRRWAEKEMVGDHVTMQVREVVGHYGQTIVRSRYDGTYDKTNLPPELVMSDYFSVRDGKIVSLTVIRNQPSPY